MSTQKSRKSKRRPKAPRRPARTKDGAAASLRVSWKGLPKFEERSGRPTNRHYKLETLKSAIELQLRTADKFILSNLRREMGPAPIASITFVFVDENDCRFVFKILAVNRKGKRGTTALMVAKNAKEMSSMTEANHRNLESLRTRSRRHTVRLMGSGTVFLPDRYRRKSEDREIFMYARQWLAGYHELSVGKGNQFCIMDNGRKSFSKTQTEFIRRSLVEIVACSYDPVSRSCIDLSQWGNGMFVVTKPLRNNPTVKLISCPRLSRRASRGKLMHEMIRARWSETSASMRLAPDDPREVFAAIVAAVGMEEALRWIKIYGEAIHKGRFRESEHFSLSDMAALRDEA